MDRRTFLASLLGLAALPKVIREAEPEVPFEPNYGLPEVDPRALYPMFYGHASDFGEQINGQPIIFNGRRMVITTTPSAAPVDITTTAWLNPDAITYTSRG